MWCYSYPSFSIHKGFLFSSGFFKISLSSIFCSFNMTMWLFGGGIDFACYSLSLLNLCLVSDINSGKFRVIMASNNSSVPFSLSSPSDIPIIWTLPLLSSYSSWTAYSFSFSLFPLCFPVLEVSVVISLSSVYSVWWVYPRHPSFPCWCFWFLAFMFDPLLESPYLCSCYWPFLAFVHFFWEPYHVNHNYVKFLVW